ncbi:MAG: hypothetical protein IPG50_37940 [Myxococcales bacterium]|nr:hypothetical protein [Myxococcales bacterium]
MNVSHGPRALLLSCALVAGAPACGHGVPSAGVARVRVTGRASALDPYASRLAAATSALEGLVGHPLEIEIDGALAPESSSFGADVAREIETLVSDLAWRRARRDPVFEGLMREWKRIEVHYEPVNPSRLFDPARGALIVRLGVGARWEAGRALRDELDRRFERRYEGTVAEQVPRDELAPYAGWLSRQARGDDAQRGARALGPLLAVLPLLPQEEQRESRLALLRGVWIARAGTLSRPVVALDGTTQRLFSEWAARTVSQLDAEELDVLVRSVVTAPPLPGLDAATLVMLASDAWARAGRPVLAFAAPDAQLATLPPLVGRVLTPGPSCPNPMLYEAIGRSDGLESLAKRLDGGDPVLRAIVFLHLSDANCDAGRGSVCQRVLGAFCKQGFASLPRDLPQELATRATTRCGRGREHR